jgi:hypothetical protein
MDRDQNILSLWMSGTVSNCLLIFIHYIVVLSGL